MKIQNDIRFETLGTLTGLRETCFAEGLLLCGVK